ncbi:hypothetical protein PQX77_011414 [Marasmius sp. AFHP31]|nr:hypothetical protein PQX77_011414 [Marasmius sp. AFHP31]
MKNLESFAEGFPLAESTTQSGIVPLGEKGETLRLFLRFTHNQPVSDLSSLDIDGLLDLAEVADKYGNHYALAACRQPMRLLADESPDNALKVLRFKAIHRDFEGIDVVAVKTINFPIIHVLKVFGQNHTQEFAVWGNRGSCEGYITLPQALQFDQRQAVSVLSAIVSGCITVQMSHEIAEERQCPDRKNLGAHTKNMEILNSAFPVVCSVKHQVEDIVELTESEDTLKLLIVYSHNCEHEDLRHLGAQKLVAFARAAEKYGNFFALDACKIAMKSLENAIHILFFQAAHSIYDGIDHLAGLTMESHQRLIWTVAERVDPKLFYLWSLYRDDWRAAHIRYTAALGQYCSASDTEKRQLFIIRTMSEKVTSWLDIATVDTAIGIAMKLRPREDDRKFLDDSDMKRWYDGVKAAIDSFPRWEEIVRNEALFDG